MFNRDHSNQTVTLASVKEKARKLLRTAERFGSGYMQTPAQEDGVWWLHMETVGQSIGSGNMYMATRIIRVSQITMNADRTGVSVTPILALTFVGTTDCVSVLVNMVGTQSYDCVRLSDFSPSELKSLNAALDRSLRYRWT